MTILKPLIGCDSLLAANLESFFTMNYPTVRQTPLFDLSLVIFICNIVGDRHPFLLCLWARDIVEPGAAGKLIVLGGN